MVLTVAPSTTMATMSMMKDAGNGSHGGNGSGQGLPSTLGYYCDFNNDGDDVDGGKDDGNVSHGGNGEIVEPLRAVNSLIS